MKIGMLFPGYGSQFVGMGKELYDSSRTVQEYFEEASHCLNNNFVKLCFASSDIELSRIGAAYPALFLSGVSTATLIKESGINIDAVAGYGIGEYSALCFAGGLSFPDGLYMLTKLANFYTQMREELDAKSISIDGLSAKKLSQICKENSSQSCGAHISIYENKNEHIVTGHTDAVNTVAELATDAGADKVKKLDMLEGFHTPLLNDVVNQLKIYLTKVDFKDLKIPLISGVNGKEVCFAKKAQDAFMNQIVKPIFWHDVLKQFENMDVIIVPSPASTLVKELQSYYPDKRILPVDTVADLENLKNNLTNGVTAEITQQIVEEINI